MTTFISSPVIKMTRVVTAAMARRVMLAVMTGVAKSCGSSQHELNRRFLPARLMVLGLVLVFTACTSPTWQRAQRADGLIDFMLDGEHAELPVRVERVSSGDGTVASVHVRSHGSGALVFGLVRRHLYRMPPPGSHVDVIVLDAQGHVVQGTAVEYLPRQIPYERPTSRPQSRYSARLASRPSIGSSVKVVFHGVPKSKCEFVIHP